MILTPAQNLIASDTHRFRVISSGRRFGKTVLAIEEMKGKAVSRECKIVYVAPTIQQARDIAWLELLKELRPISLYVNESRLEIKVRTIVPGKSSTIALRGWEAIETLRGQSFDLIVLDEVASMRNFFENWQEVIRPTLTDRKGEAIFISTPKGFNHFYDLYGMEHKDKDYKSFHFTSYDNPHIPKDELDKAAQELPADRFAQEYMADFRKAEGLVYKEFNREKHVWKDEVVTKKVLATTAMRIVGLDWGYTNPTAILSIYLDTDSHYWVMNEYFKAQKTTAEIIEYAGSLQGMKYYPDPAEPDRNEEMRKAGLNVQEVSKDVEAGINSVRELFKTGRLHIHGSCLELINELETYHYPEKKADKNEPELPVKEDDHLVDALRYALYMQSSQKLKQIASHFYPARSRY